MINLIAIIAGELSLQEYQVANAVKLLVDEECTIPFVARYRKEMTGTLDEVALRAIRERHLYITELETNKEKYLKVVAEHCKKSPELMARFPELRAKFEACATKQALEDLYLPFKPKRRTRAQIAREKGLGPLADQVLARSGDITDLAALAQEFVTPADAQIDPALRVESVDAALAGASDILAEAIAETAELRGLVREISFATGVIVAKKVEIAERGGSGDAPKEGKGERQGGKKSDASKYQNYFDYKEPAKSAAPHRIMAVRRGEAEKVLRVTIDVDIERILAELKLEYLKVRAATPAVRLWLGGVIEDAYKRLMSPSIETEIRLQLKQVGESEAIRVFAQNLENLLLLPPIPGKVVLGVDPGIRTGSKLAVVDETGKLLAHTTVYPDFAGKETDKTVRAKSDMTNLIKTHNVGCVAVGNGTGSREIDRIVASVLRDGGFQGVKRVVVNEAGASVYSTDEIAREEFPNLDPTIRSAVSIARRLQDPLAELVKIDPRSIGVGQYQHDVNVTKLTSSLEEVVESCVNRVGVNVNTASYKLLSYVSGIGPALAKNIVTFREKAGRFPSRAAIGQVGGFGPKSFQQAAGFLRVPDAENPLDNSAVHPERYDIIAQIAEDLKKPLADFIGNRAVVEAIALEKYVTASVGMPTLQDIAAELIKPGRDPREDGARLLFSDEVAELEDLKPDMVLKGTVTNVTNFGAFVDIGVHQDGLVHISELAETFVSDPSTVIAVGQVIEVRIIEVDVKRRRISLSRRLKPQPGQNAPRSAGQSNATGGDAKPRHPTAQSSGDRNPRSDGGNRQQPQRQQQGGGRPPPPGKPRDQRPQFTVEDLLSKFNVRK